MKFSDEMINAYADGELQGSEKAEFESVLQDDYELQQALQNVNMLKTQLREAYQNVGEPEQKLFMPLRHSAASYAVLLLLAFTSGWFGSDAMRYSSQESIKQAAIYQEKGQHAHNEVDGKYILHIGSQDDAKFKRTIEEIESLVTTYQNANHPLELEVIANAGGLNLFREEATPYAKRVKQLIEQYPYIKFIACTNAIERLRERGIEPNLINSVHKGPTALDQVVKRMSDGWTYIKI